MIEPWAEEALAASIEPVEPPPALRARLMAQIAEGPVAEGLVAEGLVAEVRAGKGEWVPLGPPGVERRMLYRDATTGQKTFLLKMAPGSTLPAHRHRMVEQCLVMEGEIGWEGARYGAGDFLVVGTEREHTPVYSESGAVILIVGG